MKRNILGVVLAGGESRRMGKDKAGLRFAKGKTQLSVAVSLLDAFCARVVVSSNSDAHETPAFWRETKRIADDERAEGPMAGVIAALEEAAGWPVLVLAADMPLIDAAATLQLVNRRIPEKLATCFAGSDQRLEPLFAIYEAASLEPLCVNAGKGWFSLRRFLEDSDVERIALARSELLASVNTPEEAAAARAALERGG